MVSPAVSVMTYAGESSGIGKRVIIPVVDAGAVVIPPGTWPDGAEARFLSYTRAPVVFERRSQLSRALAGVALPTGTGIAGVFSSDGQALAISRPFEVASGQRIQPTVAKPDVGTDVFVVVSRTAMDPDESLALLTGDRTRSADVLVRTQLRVYGIWYGQSGPGATLQFTSKNAVIPPTDVRFSPAKVVTVRTKAESHGEGTTKKEK
jgi:hypothetical protein